MSLFLCPGPSELLVLFDQTFPCMIRPLALKSMSLTLASTSYAVTSRTSQTTAGTPMLTTNYPMSNVTAFDLTSFYFSCVTGAGTQPAAQLPTACNLAVEAYQGNDN